jgi:hypothetical protein
MLLIWIKNDEFTRTCKTKFLDIRSDAGVRKRSRSKRYETEERKIGSTIITKIYSMI